MMRRHGSLHPVHEAGMRLDQKVYLIHFYRRAFPCVF